MADTGVHEALHPLAPGASHRVAHLAAARVAAQALGLVWFVVAARTLSSHDLGILSSGLALVVVLGGISDLGTTRTVVRHVAGRSDALRATLRRALALRVAAAIAIGLGATALVPAVSDLAPATVALGAWIAGASGSTEVAFAGLRSIGRARTEVRVLVFERVAFTLAALVALHLGAGPFTLLALYGATNTVSALASSAMGFRLAHGALPSGPFFDREGRGTAIGATLQIIGPRAGLVTLVLLGSAHQVAAYSVAQKPTEALALLVAALAAPVLPMVRATVLARDDARAGLISGRVAAAGMAVAAGALGWLIADPSGGLSLLLGDGSDLRAAGALRALAIAALLAVVRGALELLLLAHERATALMWATTAGLVVTVGLGVALVGAHGASGAALASLAGEAVALGLVAVTAVRLARGADLVRPLAASAALVVATGAVVQVGQASPLMGIAVAGVASLAGVAIARGHVVALDRLS